MALNVQFTHDPESYFKMAGEELLAKETVPYRIRREVFEKEIQKNPELEWGQFISVFDDDSWRREFLRRYPLYRRYEELRTLRKPLLLWVTDFIARIEREVKSKGIEFLSWKFSYYVVRSQSEEAIRFSPPVWFLEVVDRERQSAHPNWTIMMDSDGDFHLKRGVATDEDPMWRNSLSFWKKSDVRFVDAIRSYMRLRGFRNSRK